MRPGALERAFKDVVTKDDNRPVLQNLHLTSDGSAVATDTHVLLRIRKFHNLGINVNFNLLKFFPELDESDPLIGGGYPDIDKLISGGPGDVTFDLMPDDLRKALPVLKSMFYTGNRPERDEVVSMEIENNADSVAHLQIGSATNQMVLVTRNTSGGDDMEQTGINPRYLYNAFRFFADYLGRFGGSVRVDWYGAVKPIKLSVDNIDYLITPVRIV